MRERRTVRNLRRPCDNGKRPDIVPVIGVADLEAVRLRAAWAAAWRRVHGVTEDAGADVVRLADRRQLERAA